jgi:hypothetical protein
VRDLNKLDDGWTWLPGFPARITTRRGRNWITGN